MIASCFATLSQRAYNRANRLDPHRPVKPKKQRGTLDA